MIIKTLAAIVVVLSTGSAAMASGIPGIMMSKDGRVTSTLRGTGIYTPPPRHDYGAKVIFSNIAVKYPDGLYFCCSGATVSAPDSILKFQSWPAMQFTPSADATVTEIDVSVQLVTGTNEVDLNFYADANGLPGTLLDSAKVTGLQGTGSCCSFSGAKDRKGIPVIAGAHYWVAVTTDSGGTDTFANWAFNTTDQLDALPSAVNKGAGWVTNGGAVPAPSFAVYGK
jgi:hypothetical protein